MLRTLLKIAAGFLVLTLLLLGGLAMALPRFVQTEEFQSALRSRAAETLGVGVEWHHAEVGIAPPRVILDSLVLRDGDEAGTAAEVDAGLRADSVDLRVSLIPLISRRVEVESLVFHGVDLAVSRTDAGWVLPFELGAEAGVDSDGAEGSGLVPEANQEAGAGAFSLLFGRVQLEDTSILVRDRTGSRSIDWRLSGLDFDATQSGALESTAPMRYSVRFDSDCAAGETSMGRVEGEGEVVREVSAGTVDFNLTLDLDGAKIEELISYLPLQSGKGILSGNVRILGSVAEIQEIGVDLRVESLATQFAELDLAGLMSIEGVQRPGSNSDFDVALDLTEGGRIEVAGTRAEDGALNAKSHLEQVDLAMLKKFVGPERSVSGVATGDLSWVSRGDGSFSALNTDLQAVSFGFSDKTHRLEDGALAIAMTFGEEPPVPGADQYGFSGTFDGSGKMPSEGKRSVEGALNAELKLAQANLAALPFDFSVATLPTGSLTGDVSLSGNWASHFEDTSSENAAAGARAAPKSLLGILQWNAELGAQGPADVDTKLTFASGGSIHATGPVSRDGDLNLTTQVRELDLKVLSPLLPLDDAKLDGVLSGPGRVRGPAAAPTRFEIDANVADGQLIAGEYQVVGPYAAKLDIKNPLSPGRSGQVDLDLTRARVLYEGRFEKKAGVPALLDAKFEPNPSGETEFESRLRLKNLDRIQIQGALGETSAFSMTAASLDLGQAAEFIPGLATYQASGKASLSDFEIRQSPAAPIHFDGRLELGNVALMVPDAGSVVLNGGVVGDGNRLRTEALELVTGDVKIELEGHLEDPLGEGRFSFSGRTVGSPEVNSLLSALTSKRDTVFGPLHLEGDFSGTTAESENFMESMIGTLRFSVGEDVGGKLRGVSILRSVLMQMPLLGSSLWSTPFRGGRSVEDFFSDEFEVIEGEFLVREGAVEAKKLRLAYQGYEANLSGLMQLKDLSLDMTGELSLQGDLIAVLVGALGGDGTDRDPIQIPLARVSNTLSEPKVSMTSRTLAAIPKILVQATGIDRLKDGLQEGLGKILNRTPPLVGGN